MRYKPAIPNPQPYLEDATHFSFHNTRLLECTLHTMLWKMKEDY